MLLTVVVFSYAKLRRQSMALFPDKFTRKHLIFCSVTFALYASATANYIEGFPAVVMLIYGTIVTPMYEELLFRGYFWERFKAAFDDEKAVLLWNIGLFTVWHLGYIMPNIIDGNLSAVLWTLAAGLGYGTVLGVLRYKCKNAYGTFLLHGVLNLFMV